MSIIKAKMQWSFRSITCSVSCRLSRSRCIKHVELKCVWYGHQRACVHVCMMNGLSPETLNVADIVFSRCGDTHSACMRYPSRPCCWSSQSRSHANVTLSLIEDPRWTHITCYCYGCDVLTGILSLPSIIQMISWDDMYSHGYVSLKGNLFFKSAGKRTRIHVME